MINLNVQNRVPSLGKANRKLITPEDGSAPYYAKIEYADDPIEPGTPIDQTLFNQLNPEIGDIITTAKDISSFTSYIPTDGRYLDSFVYTGLYAELGKRYGSRIGAEWAPISSSVFPSCADIAYYNGIYISCHYDSGSYMSTDLINWIKLTSYTWNARSIDVHNGLWVISPISGYLHYSTNNGQSWIQVSGILSSFEFLDVLYEKNIWIASTRGYGLYYSIDGINWNPSNISSSSYSKVYYNNGVFIATSDEDGYFHGYLRSTDGITWVQITSLPTSNFLAKYIYGNGNIWMTSNRDTNASYRSVDNGATWASMTVPNYTYNAVICSNQIWRLFSSSSVNFYSTNNGQSWSQATNNVSATSVLAVDNNIIATNGGVAAFSADNGYNWITSLSIGTVYNSKLFLVGENLILITQTTASPAFFSLGNYFRLPLIDGNASYIKAQ